jgi:3-hydroxyacyl-CoA dehydrogenase
MHTLRRIRNNDLDIVIDFSHEFGEIFATIETVARVTGASIAEVEEIVNEVHKDVVKSGGWTPPDIDEMLGTKIDDKVVGILRQMRFVNSDTIAEVMEKYNQKLLMHCVQVMGIRGLFRELAGLEFRANKWVKSL